MAHIDWLFLFTTVKRQAEELLDVIRLSQRMHVDQLPFPVCNWAKAVVESPEQPFGEDADGDVPDIESINNSRILRGITSTFAVAPNSAEYFIAYSYRDGDWCRYRVSTEDDTCECKDYLFNTSCEEYNHCKHVWRVKMLQDKGCLPKNKTQNLSWVISLATTVNKLNAFDEGILTPNEYSPYEVSAESLYFKIISLILDQHQTGIAENMKTLVHLKSQENSLRF